MIQSKRFNVLLVGLFVLVAVAAWQSAVAEDVVHAVSGIVKSVDKGTKTMVVKTADRTEHTIKWTDKTTAKGVDASARPSLKAARIRMTGSKRVPRSRLNITEKGGEKTADKRCQ